MFLSSAESRPVHLRRDSRTTRKSYCSSRLNRVDIEGNGVEFTSCEFHSSGNYILSANERGEIHIRDTDGSCGKLAYLKGHSKHVNEVHFSRDETEIYSASEDRSIGIWDSMRGCRKSSITGHTSRVTCIQYPRTGSTMLCSGSYDKTLRLWDVRQHQCAAATMTDSYVFAVCFSDCGNYIFSGGNHSGIDVRDIRMIGRQNLLGRGPCSDVRGISLSPCGNYLAVCDINGLFKWNTAELIQDPDRNIRHFHSSRRALECCAWSADGSMLTALNSRLNLLVIDSHRRETVRRLECHGCVIADVAFHPTKRVLMSAGEGLVLQEF